ncbi:MAG TPA: NADH-quinone oxidoreductase subunit N [Terriglobales bacterium]|jgi:NADH-quinone oxidoreductase subunit N|nr:NADH-quinone oxidoreductase subunit N [Terriglobales bacterium]
MLPMLELCIFALGILLIDLMVPKSWKWINAAAALVGVFFAALCVWQLQSTLPPRVLPAFYNSLLVDRFAIYFWCLFLAAAAISILMSVHYLDLEDEHHGEYYALLLLSVVGMMCIAAGIDVVLIFIGLELMAISTYVLVGFLRRDRRSNEAALKYMLLGAFSSGIFAYGLSLFYGIAGSTNLVVIERAVSGQNTHNPVVIIALLTTMVGLLFKIAAIPFHQWAPDAYEGAPTSITGFMSVAVKAAAWAMLLRILGYPILNLPRGMVALGLYPLRTIYTPLIIFVSIATMTGANFAALTQSNTKRLLAYSSIAHVGYMLLAFVAMGTSQPGTPGFLDGFKGILIYLMVYTFMNLGAFAVITSLRQRNVIGDELDDMAGLYQRAPVEAVLMLLFLLSLAGIPPAAGFLGKYYIFLSLIESQHYALAALGVVYSLFGLYYYLKIANSMLVRAPMERERLPVSFGMRCAVGITALATLFIGIYPEPAIRSVNWSLGIRQPRPVAVIKK